MRVLFHPEAERELDTLFNREKTAMDHAREKLEAMGARLPFPHQSAVKNASNLRELRPRSGRSPWRAFYRRVGDAMVIAAIGPEAEVDPRGFARAVKRAEDRLATVEAAERTKRGRRDR